MYLKGTRPFPFERLDAVAEFFGRTAVEMLVDRAARPAAAPPETAALHGSRVTITPGHLDPEITVWLLGPPAFVVVKLERSASVH